MYLFVLPSEQPIIARLQLLKNGPTTPRYRISVTLLLPAVGSGDCSEKTLITDYRLYYRKVTSRVNLRDRDSSTIVAHNNRRVKRR